MLVVLLMPLFMLPPLSVLADEQEIPCSDLEPTVLPRVQCLSWGGIASASVRLFGTTQFTLAFRLFQTCRRSLDVAWICSLRISKL